MKNIQNAIQSYTNKNVFNSYKELTISKKILFFISLIVYTAIYIPLFLVENFIELLIKLNNYLILTPLAFFAEHLSTGVKNKTSTLVLVTKKNSITVSYKNPDFTTSDQKQSEMLKNQIVYLTNAIDSGNSDTDHKNYLQKERTIEAFKLNSLNKIIDQKFTSSIKINDSTYLHYYDSQHSDILLSKDRFFISYDDTKPVISIQKDYNILQSFIFGLARIVLNMFIIAITAVDFFVLDWRKFFNTKDINRKFSSDLLMFGFILLNLVLLKMPISYGILISLLVTSVASNNSEHKFNFYNIASNIFIIILMSQLKILSFKPYMLLLVCSAIVYLFSNDLKSQNTKVNNSLYWVLFSNLLMFSAFGLASLITPYFYGTSVISLIGLSQVSVLLLINLISLIIIAPLIISINSPEKKAAPAATPQPEPATEFAHKITPAAQTQKKDTRTEEQKKLATNRLLWLSHKQTQNDEPGKLLTSDSDYGSDYELLDLLGAL